MTTNKSKFKDWQADHLFLIMGTNPLPVYVVAKLLTKPTTKLYLITTSAISSLVTNLREQLPKLSKFDQITVDDPYDDRVIKQRLDKYLKDLSVTPGETVGLNYTGGTKPMSLYIDKVLEAWCEAQQRAYTPSYLDPREITLRFPNGEKLSIEPTDCPITFDQLVNLHGWEVTSSEQTPILPNFARALVKVVNTPTILDSWRQWCNQNLRTWLGRNWWMREAWPAIKKLEEATDFVKWVEADQQHMKQVEIAIQMISSDRRKTKKRELQDMIIPDLLASVTQAQTMTELVNEFSSQTDWGVANRGFDKTCFYLDGGWLEDYVLGCLQRCAEKGIVDNIRSNVVIQRRESKTDFEFDIVALKGYQLFALSCTTSNSRPASKSKLLEAYTRARQMGGDEARVALITGYDDAIGLLREVNEDWLAPHNMIRVFGFGDWANLQQKLTEWFD